MKRTANILLLLTVLLLSTGQAKVWAEEPLPQKL